MPKYGIEKELEESVTQQIEWKSSPEAGDIWGQPGESAWARDEWGKIIDGKVTLFHGTSQYVLNDILKEGIRLGYFTPPEELGEDEEPQAGIWLTTTPYYAFFYGDVAVRVRIPVEWIDSVMGDEVWIDYAVPPWMIIDWMSADAWKSWTI